MDSVSLRYFIRLLRDLRERGEHKAVKLLLTDPDTVFGDTRVWWVRTL